MRQRILIIYLLYRVLLWLAFPVISVYALLRVFKNRRYAATLRQRLGVLPNTFCQRGPGAIWIHAVSVGEVISAETLIGSLHAELPGTQVFVSTATLAGYATASDRLAGSAAGVFYAPLDYVFPIRRVLRTLQPSLVIVLETEIWPNLFREVKRAGCGLLIANGRISDKAAPAYRRHQWFFKSVLCWPDKILVQSAAMLERFIESGAPADRTLVTGNLKYDLVMRSAEPDSPVLEWLAMADGPVLIGASTTEGALVDEDTAVLNAFEKLPGWRLILAPRKPERFDGVADMLTARAIRFWRRSTGVPDAQASVLLLDTIGELAPLFERASVVFMGGTLTETEGHNLLEPAFAGRPIVSGPRVANFREIAEDLRAHHAFIEIERPEELAAAVLQAAQDTSIGERARHSAQLHRGAVERVTAYAKDLYSRSLYLPSRLHRGRVLLAPLSRVWTFESRRRFAKQLLNSRALATPVISVGNISVGGTGKTPMVLRIAQRLFEQGVEPVTLTRGYGRSSHHGSLVLARGAKASPIHTGDEPQVLLRSGFMGLGIGGDRYAVGRAAEEKLHPDVFLLDDGFSHVRLRRNLDIVLIDTLDPFGRGAAIPLGRLREPMEALERAEVFILTRCRPGLPLDAIEFTLRQYNARAPIFRARLKPGEWQSFQTGHAAELPERTVAFCGLGNPESFWSTLDRLGIHPMDSFTFSDHFHYGPRELRRIIIHAKSIGATALLTTQKDVVNFCAGSDQLLGEMDLLWLPVHTEIDREDDLFELINRACIREQPA